MAMREKFEDGFEAWAGIVARWRYAIVFVALLATALSATQLQYLELDTSTESYLLERDPVREAYADLRAQFGRDEIALVALEPDEVFDLEFLHYLRELHEALEDGVPHLERITSLVNIRSVEGRGDQLIVGDLLEDMPTNDHELEALRRKVMSTKSYLDGVISRDGKLTMIVLETSAFSTLGDDVDALAQFDDVAHSSASNEDAEPAYLTPEENARLVEATKAIADEFRRPGIDLHVAGSTMVTHEVSNAMQREVPLFLGGSLAVIAVALIVLFRRIGPCLISLAVVSSSLVASLGTAGALGQAASILSQILPSFLLSVGVGYSVHIFAIYFQRRDRGETHDAALVGALRHSGPPIMMTALTTMTGLASFLVAEMPPMRDFGLTAMIGVGWTLIFNLCMLPALICIIPTRGRGESEAAAGTTRLLLWLGTTSARNPWKVTLASLTLAVLSLVSALRVDLSNNPIAYLAPENSFRVAWEYLDERIGSSMSIELFIDAGEENALYEPAVMNRLDALGGYFAHFELDGHTLGRTTSVVDIAKETHQALNANDPAYYAVPQQRSLLAQELLLFENSGSDDMERVVDSQFRLARYSVGTRFRDGNELARVVRKVQADVPELLGPGIDATVTGASTLIARTVDATGISLARTYGLALVAITPLMMILIGSLRSGLVSMAPNLLPILLTIGLMPVVDWPLDIFTMMVGCIAIGLAVDDTLHFIHGFRARLAVNGDPHLAIEETLQTTGRALLFTSIVLTMGFLVLTFSSMANLRALGFLTAFAISAAFILDIIVTPALLILVTRKRYAVRNRA